MVPKLFQIKGALECYGVDVTEKEFRLFCPDKKCDLNDKIPVSIVDEDLYLKPPTLLLGTVDKFARMLHQQESWSFMGLNKIPVGDHNIDVLPPTLVVQDELHLIDGPLGTIAGMYEAAFDTIIKQKGVNIKYIAATATYYC